MNRFSTTFTIGLILGLAFFGHAMINNSHAWPLVWPLAAGALAVAIAARKGRLQSFWRGIGLAVKAGSVAGALFFAATLAALTVLASSEPLGAAMGAEGPIVIGLNLVLSLAFAAFLGVLLAALAGAATYPVIRGRGRG